jgi:hypothetical protein
LVEELRAELGAVCFPFPAPSSAAATDRRTDLLNELDQTVLPALRQVGDPIVIALVGGSGAGKSVLANSLAGKALSPVSPLRPTTKLPLLLARPETLTLLGLHPVKAVTQAVADSQASPGCAVVDCGDPFAAGNDPATAQVDVPVSAWLVVTSALRYGDSLTWDLLQGLGRDGYPVALVVTRLPDKAWDLIQPDLRQRLEALKMDYVQTLPVPEVDGSPDELASSAISSVMDWLTAQFGPPPEVGESLPVFPWTRIALQTAELVKDQAVHARTVNLLREATLTELATQVTGARAALPDPSQPTLVESWLELIAPDGPLADLISGQPATSEQSRRRDAGLACLGGKLSDAVQAAAVTVSAGSAQALADLWTGGSVPDGSRGLLEDAALTAPRPADGQTTWSDWLEFVRSDLADRPDLTGRFGLAQPSAPAEPLALAGLTVDGLVTIIQAAAIGLPGPLHLLRQLAGQAYEAPVEAARQGLLAGLAKTASQAGEPYLAALNEVEQPVTGSLVWLAEAITGLAGEAAK